MSVEVLNDPGHEANHTGQESLPRANVVEFSSANYFDPLILGNMFVRQTPFHELADGIREVGYVGFEWHALRSGFRPQRELLDGSVSSEDKPTIITQHEGFRDERSVKQVFSHHRPFEALGAYILLPHRIKTLELMERIQAELGRETPVVLFKGYETDERKPNDVSFLERLYQPTAEELDRFGATDLEDMLRKGYESGFTGIVPDLAHLRETHDGKSLGHWREVLGRMLEEKPAEIHVGFRPDLKDRVMAQKSMDELEDMLKGGSEASELVQMLMFLQQSRWQGRVVIEVPAMALRKFGKVGTVTPLRDLMAIHRKLVGNVMAKLGGAA